MEINANTISIAIAISSNDDINDYCIVVSDLVMKRLKLDENDKVTICRLPMVSTTNVIESLCVKKYGNEVSSNNGRVNITSISPSNYSKMCFDVGIDVCIIFKTNDKKEGVKWR